MEEEYTQNINPSTSTPRQDKFKIWEKKPNLEEMLKKFISVSETRFQNTEIALMSQQHREQLNVITIQDKEGLVEPEPEPRQRIVETRLKSIHESHLSNNKGPIYEERRLQIEELDEWRIQKPRVHDRPKPHHDELNVSPNQLKVGDKVLLDATDPCIATSEPDGAIPLTILSILPYGMRSVNSSHYHDHTTERLLVGFKVTKLAYG
ncbi:hypothetical protein GOBAR_AA25072 [Gossypium barbadense]|uniref:Uncharacterized protein n=1 Tax=Gossypium barbadense TaxID=3634 RepID=A0A2P5WWY6_GOSBA|nr:hypothetical protein GOBAR_AA25072 [Gossypium barbadense]